MSGEGDPGIAGEFAGQRRPLDFAGAFQVHMNFRKVPENFHPADNFPRFATDGRHADLHGDAVPVLALGEYDDRGGVAFPRDDGPVQWAIFLAAEGMAVLVDMGEDVVATAFPQDFIGRPPGDAFGGGAPVHDPPLAVGYIHAIVEGIQNPFVVEESRLGHRGINLRYGNRGMEEDCSINENRLTRLHVNILQIRDVKTESGSRGSILIGMLPDTAVHPCQLPSPSGRGSGRGNFCRGCPWYPSSSSGG